MPLENILQALEAEAARQVAEIEQNAQAEIERIRTQAQQKAAAIRKQHLAEIQAPLRAEQARILNQAKLEALQIVMGTREALIDSALQATAQRLAALCASEAYTPLLRHLTQEAVDTLGGEDHLHLRVRSCDVDRMTCLVQYMGLSATVAGELEHEDESQEGGLGGLVVATADGRISLVNTLEARLRRVASLYRSQIAEMVFGAEQED